MFFHSPLALEPCILELKSYHARKPLRQAVTEYLSKLLFPQYASKYDTVSILIQLTPIVYHGTSSPPRGMRPAATVAPGNACLIAATATPASVACISRATSSNDTTM